MSTIPTSEVWTDPDGRAADLTPIGTVLDWYPEGPGQRPPYTYEMRTPQGVTLRSDTVYPYEPWSPYDAISDRLVADGWSPPAPSPEDLATCEHGLSADLCAGPGHYPADEGM